MADINWLAVAFEVIIGAVAVLLFLTYYLFVKMNDDVRRARLYLMADRIKRFLLAFFIGFLAFVVDIAGALALGSALPSWLSGGLIFLWIGAVTWGCVELLLVAGPRQLRKSRSIGMADGGSRESNPSMRPRNGPQR